MSNVSPFIKVIRMLKKVIEKREKELNNLLEERESIKTASGLRIKNIKTNKVETIDLKETAPKSKNPFKRLSFIFKKRKTTKIYNEVVEDIESRIEGLTKSITIMKETLECFTSTGYKKVIDDISLLTFKILQLDSEETLCTEELKILIGLAIRKKAEFYQTNSKARKEILSSNDQTAILELNSCLELKQYFNKKGQIKPGGDEENFSNLLNNLYAFGLQVVKKEKIMLEELLRTENLIEELCIELRYQNSIMQKAEANKEAIQKSIEIAEKIQREQFKLSRQNLQTEKQALAVLSNYYQNGVIIKVHPNINEFISLLQRCNLPNNQITKITRLMTTSSSKISSNIEEQFETFFSEEDLNLIKYAQENPTEGIQYFLDEIATALTFLKSAESENDKTYLKEYIAENLKNLRYTLNIPTDSPAKLTY